MAEKYKLTYYNARGLAEYARLLFKYADVEFEDIRLEREQWPEMKPKQPFGKVPVLQVGDTVIAESGAIYRYLARKFGLTGKTELEAAQADMVLEAVRDAFTQMIPFRMEPDETKKAELKKKFATEVLPPFLNNLEKILDANGSEYYVGKQLTYADIGIAHALDGLPRHIPEALDKHPTLKAHSEKTLAIPALKKWIKERPQTET